jgi:hypothetical protein
VVGIMGGKGREREKENGADLDYDLLPCQRADSNWKCFIGLLEKRKNV